MLEATHLDDRIGTRRPMDSRDLPDLRCSANPHVETNIIRYIDLSGLDFLRFFFAGKYMNNYMNKI